MLDLILCNVIGFAISFVSIIMAVNNIDRYFESDKLVLVIRDVATGFAFALTGWHSILGNLDWIHVGLLVPLSLYVVPEFIPRIKKFFHDFTDWGRHSC